ncbi:MAG: C40 family peptidase [Bacteroidetes bacterium]|nr:C40 family peptidase [Bacteroidota bacterium]
MKQICWLLWLAACPLAVLAHSPDSSSTDSASIIPEPLQAFYQRAGGFLLNQEDPLVLYTEVYRWHKTPYAWGRNTCQQATDCSGFTGKVYEVLEGLSLHRGAPGQWLQCTPISKDSLRAGDLVFFAIGQPHISHVGIYLKEYKFIHASSCCGVIIEDLRQPYYTRWWYGAGRPVRPEPAVVAAQPGGSLPATADPGRH